MKRMRRLHRAYCQSNKFVKRNSTTIMTIGGCVGFVATIILAAQAVPKARELLDDINRYLSSIRLFFLFHL